MGGPVAHQAAQRDERSTSERDRRAGLVHVRFRGTDDVCFCRHGDLPRLEREFRREDDTFRVHDVGSLNGTYLNGDRVDDAELQNGDEVRIGKFRLIFFASDAKGN